ncbi:hypothetical protein THIOM_004419 [Candidatus Thiomargarita nelsonii]|uniref:Calcineurin-like phosphoesterase domain-containing protein n=1 Tax=Candidatus Thiomargarita nelsonii TaxID=1003181 RepID=A0A176RW07_9GAMM|nr:hypothetical protein THIOM_004419 [Candidatus Thiomargarita nelsonii]
MVRFLDALSNLSPETKRLLHFIQTGDMLEMWLGREYQFRVRRGRTIWLDRESPDRTADWALEVMIQNTPVFEAFRRLQNAKLAEIKFLWGNHDAYLKSQKVTRQLGLPARDPVYIGLNQDLYAEHGHRFDPHNFDEVTYKPLLKPFYLNILIDGPKATYNNLTSGPRITNLVYYVPTVRQAEDWADDASSFFTGNPRARDTTMLGATLIYLYQRYDQRTNPLSIYVLGHTHARLLQTFNIRTEWHLYERP